MRTYKVLIVDDEPIIREGISNALNWEDLNLELMGTCEDSFDAQESFSSDPPDIAIIDIHMPGMNGLELIESVRSREIPIHFIILSGYGEFAYAQRAIALGVTQYLLKPIDPEKLKQALEDTRKQVDENSDKSRWNLETALKKALTEPSSIGNGILKKDNRRFWLIATEKGIPAIAEVVSDFQEPEFRRITFLHHMKLEDIDLLILTVDETTPTELRYSYLNALSLRFQNHRSRPVFASGTPGSAAEIAGQWEECRKKLQEYKLNDLLSIDETGVITPLSLAIQKLTHSVEEKIPEQAQEAVRKIMAVSRENDLSLMKSKELLILILNILTAGKRKQDIATGIPRQLDLMNSPDKEALEKYFLRIIVQYMEWETGEEQSPHLPWLVEKTKQEIQNNFTDHTLSLRTFCSTVVFTNPDYLGKLFHKHMHLSFHSYLNQVRIEASKLLILQNPYLTMYEVARQVGFGDNSQYFSRVFKSLEEISPSQFKERIKKGLLI